MDILDPKIGTALAGTAAVLTAIVTAAATLLVSRKAAYVNSVTLERSKWINSLRQDLTNLIGCFYLHTAQVYLQKGYGKSEDARTNLSKLMSLSTTISLQLRPNSVVEDNVHNLILSCVELATLVSQENDRTVKNLIIYSDILVMHCRWLMKFEWERVRIESSGPFRSVYLRLRVKKMKSDYGYFLTSDGYFERVFSEEQIERLADVKKRRQSSLFFRSSLG